MCLQNLQLPYIGKFFGESKTIDFLLTAKRDKAAAIRFFKKVMYGNGIPEKVTKDKCGATDGIIMFTAAQAAYK